MKYHCYNRDCHNLHDEYVTGGNSLLPSECSPDDLIKHTGAGTQLFKREHVVEMQTLYYIILHVIKLYYIKLCYIMLY